MSMVNEAETVNAQRDGPAAGTRIRSIYELKGGRQPSVVQALVEAFSPAAYARNRIAELERQVVALTQERDRALDARDASSNRSAELAEQREAAILAMGEANERNTTRIAELEAYAALLGSDLRRARDEHADWGLDHLRGKLASLQSSYEETCLRADILHNRHLRMRRERDELLTVCAELRGGWHIARRRIEHLEVAAASRRWWRRLVPWIVQT